MMRDMISPRSTFGVTCDGLLNASPNWVLHGGMIQRSRTRGLKQLSTESFGTFDFLRRSGTVSMDDNLVSRLVFPYFQRTARTSFSQEFHSLRSTMDGPFQLMSCLYYFKKSFPARYNFPSSRSRSNSDSEFLRAVRTERIRE